MTWFSSSEASMPGTVIIHTAMFAQSAGVPWREITEQTGLTPADMIEPERRYPNEIATTLWRLIFEANPEEPMTLRMAMGTPPRALGALSFGARFARDLRQLMDVLVRFGRISLSNTVKIDYIPTPDPASRAISFRNPGLHGPYAMAMPDMRVASAFRHLGPTSGFDLRDVTEKIVFGYEAFGPRQAYEDYYQVPIEFEPDVPHAFVALYFLPGALDQPLAQSDEGVFSFVIRQLRLQYDRVFQSDPLDVVRDAVERNAGMGDYNAESVARALGKSLRSLQRDLQSRDMSLRDMIEEARVANARRLLTLDDLSLTQIAEQLDYSSASTFRRAFKRSVGVTPAEYRASLHQEG